MSQPCVEEKPFENRLIRVRIGGADQTLHIHEENDEQIEEEEEDVTMYLTPEGVKLRLHQNQEFLKKIIENNNWTVTTEGTKLIDGKAALLITNPTASKMMHRILNPFIYRCIKRLDQLDELAELVKAPRNWKDIYNEICQDPDVDYNFRDFRSLPFDEDETRVQSRFINLIITVSVKLGVGLTHDSTYKTVVGGLLAYHEYEFKSSTDPVFYRRDGLNLLATEIKKGPTLLKDDTWYMGCRGVQTLAALFSCNCPTFLLNQQVWKIFVESSDRTEIFSFVPNVNDDPNDFAANDPHSMVLVGQNMLRAITICLLSKRELTQNNSNVLKVPVSETPLQTPEKTASAKKAPPDSEKVPKKTFQYKGPCKKSSSSD